MTRETVRLGSGVAPNSWLLDTSLPKGVASDIDPRTLAGVAFADGDTWFSAALPVAPPAPNPYTRPSGLGYVRYEDLWRPGDTISTAMARLGAGSINALPDGSGIITFPEGQFVSSDFKAAGSTTYSIYVPKNCKGIIGSGPGTLGGSTGTVFTIAPNSWTSPFAPLQSTGQGNAFQMMYRGTGTVSNSTPITFSQFQIAGTSQGDTDGRTYHGLTMKNPEGPVTFQNLLACGWFGNNGAPPGETFGLGISGGNGIHRMIDCEMDGRRTLADPTCYGAVGWTVENTYGAQITRCNSHHGNASQGVCFQAFNTVTTDCIFGPQASGNRGSSINHERTDGTVHIRPVMHKSATQIINVTHSNDTFTANIDGHACSSVNGDLTIINPTFEPLYADGKLYIQTWTPYSNGDTMQATNPPLVTLADGVTHLPYKWVHGASVNVN